VIGPPTTRPGRDRSEQRLLDLFRRLGESERASLLDFAGYLAGRATGPAQTPQPLDIPRPADETVIRALKRLSATYPMLDKGRLMNEATALVSQHVMEGREATAVIDELEVIFRRHYEVLTGPGEETSG